MSGYLASVIVLNLLPADYDDQRIEEIEKTINSGISALDEKWKATDENMIFSFPQDPSVKSATIPVVVEVQLLIMGGVAEATGFMMAHNIRHALLSLFGEKRGDVIVIVRSQARIADFSPRF